MIDLKANSSASHADNRIYPALSWSRENTEKGTTLMAGFLPLLNLIMHLTVQTSGFRKKPKQNGRVYGEISGLSRSGKTDCSD
jgi:hypothetical protein